MSGIVNHSFECILFIIIFLLYYHIFSRNNINIVSHLFFFCIWILDLLVYIKCKIKFWTCLIIKIMLHHKNVSMLNQNIHDVVKSHIL